MRKETQVLNDNTTMTIEHTTGRCDITITTKLNDVIVSNGTIKTVREQHYEKVFYWINLEKGEWVIRLCVKGFCYNSVELSRTMTKKDAIMTVIERHTCKHWYDFGNGEECLTTDFGASVIAKVFAEYKQEDVEYIREYDDKHFKAYPNGYVFECEETESIEVPVEDDEPAEVIEKAYAILSNPLTELDVRTSVLKSVFNRYYGKQVIDAEMDIKKTELTGYHVSGVITEAGIMMLSCDIYAQDLDITESYLAYNVGNGYAVYDEISLTRTGIYADADEVKQFFVNRFKVLETRTIRMLMVKLFENQMITPEERSYIMNALYESDENKKRVGFWIRHTAETNYTTYVCSNCGNMLIPEKLVDEPFKLCRYKTIYIKAHRYCHVCGYKMEGVKNYAHMKEWAEKLD